MAFNKLKRNQSAKGDGVKRTGFDGHRKIIGDRLKRTDIHGQLN